MNTEPYGISVFCDDIRHEINGKITLVGCYTSEMNISQLPPVVLPTFAILVNVRIPMSYEFETLKIVITKQEGEKATEVFSDEITPENQETQDTEDVKSDIRDDETFLAVTLPCKLTPFPIENSGMIKVRAYLDDKKIKIGTLTVDFPEKTES